LKYKEVKVALKSLGKNSSFILEKFGKPRTNFCTNPE